MKVMETPGKPMKQSTLRFCVLFFFFGTIIIITATISPTIIVSYVLLYAMQGALNILAHLFFVTTLLGRRTLRIGDFNQLAQVRGAIKQRSWDLNRHLQNSYLSTVFCINKHPPNLVKVFCAMFQFLCLALGNQDKQELVATLEEHAISEKALKTLFYLSPSALEVIFPLMSLFLDGHQEQSLLQLKISEKILKA